MLGLRLSRVINNQECGSRPIGAVEHAGILGPYDFSGRDSIVVRTFWRGELNHVSYGDVAKAAKHGIPMGSNAHIAGVSGQWRPGNMAGSESQCSVVIAF